MIPIWNAVDCVTTAPFQQTCLSAIGIEQALGAAHFHHKSVTGQVLPDAQIRNAWSRQGHTEDEKEQVRWTHSG